MITAFEIENFKGIRDRVRIELKPITLLFGPNSAGKSTILHALHYAREVFQRHNLDADQTAAGGRFVDLGGFHNFVNNHNVGRSVLLRFDMELDEEELETHDWLDITEVQSASVEVAVAWSQLRQAPFVEHYAVTINGELLAKIVSDFDQRRVELRKINYRHPALLESASHAFHPGQADFFAELEELTRSLVPFDTIRNVTGEDRSAAQMDPVDFSVFGVKGLRDALPHWGDHLDLVLLHEPASFRVPVSEKEGNVAKVLLYEARSILNSLLVGPGEIVRDWLQSFEYLGPIRETPPRDYRPPRFPDPSRWASGLAAWDRLHDKPGLARKVNAWLTGPDSLDVGYTVKVKSYKELPTDSPLLVLLHLGRAFEDIEDAKEMLDELPIKTMVTLIAENTNIEVAPHDVGVGISQLIPVVVLALDPDASLTAVEQPELHVHPAIQARLGDLFIQQITADPARRFLLETHSEHLLLRLLRRIRETTEGDLPPDHPGLTSEQVSVVYVELGGEEDGAKEIGQPDVPVRVRSLRIDETGEFLDQWPHGFFEERAKELF